MNYSRYATTLLIVSALVYMFEKLIKTIPYYIQLTAGQYTNLMPTVSILDNVFVMILLAGAFILYAVDILSHFKQSKISNK